jgi:hypothetical protein
MGDNSPVPNLRRRIRGWTVFFMVGLVLSGATAIPIATQVRVGERVLGEDFRAGGLIPEGAASWLRTVRDGVGQAQSTAPFLFYGTDWLAFGHFMIALAFVGAYRDPVRNRWLFPYGMIACALVPVWALIFGQLRGIPFWWRLIDASFGIFGFVPLWLCHGWAKQLEAQEAG